MMKLVSGILGIALVLMSGGSKVWAQTAASDDKESTQTKVAQKTYRLTYTLTEMDGGKHLGTQHFAMTVNPEVGNEELKMGSRVPIPIGSGVSTQFQYIDVGLNISARINEFANGVQVHTTVEQSSAVDPPNTDLHQPVIRQARLQNTALLTQGKPVVLGSLDVPGSTRHLDVEVVLEVVR
jgi:hypothetical protein